MAGGRTGTLVLTVRPIEQKWVRLLVAFAIIGLAVACAFPWFVTRSMPGSIVLPYTDTNTYLAAGERLNAGHPLYELMPGDRMVTIADTSSAPLLSPPPVAVLWRPIAALGPLGPALWVVAGWMALLGVTVHLAWRTGPLGTLVGLGLAPGMGEQLAVVNVASFFPVLLVTAWRWPAVSGPLVAFMGMLKLSPLAGFGWIAGSGWWRQVALGGAVILAGVGLSEVLAPGSLGAYLGVARDIAPSPLSLSGATGIGFLSHAVLIGGTVLAFLLSRDRPAIGFVAAVVAMVLGTPALFTAGLATLVAVSAPWAHPRS